VNILAKIVYELLSIYKYILLGSVIISWVNADPYNPIVRFIHGITEPLLGRIRRFMPDTGMLDLSPLVAFFAIQLIQSAIVRYALW
jgi:YggT family protein